MSLARGCPRFSEICFYRRVWHKMSLSGNILTGTLFRRFRLCHYTKRAWAEGWLGPSLGVCVVPADRSQAAEVAARKSSLPVTRQNNAPVRAVWKAELTPVLGPGDACTAVAPGSEFA